MRRKQTADANTQPDIADLLAAAFAHPDLPQVMWAYMADALCELDTSFDKYENPEVMREIIAGALTVSDPEQPTKNRRAGKTNR